MKPFLQGRKTISGEALRPRCKNPSAVDYTRLGASPARSDAVAGSTVEVVKEGDKVVRLIVTCACGERVEVDCLYPAGA